MEHFVAGTPARSAALRVGVNKDIAANFYHKLRIVIHDGLIEEATELDGEGEVDERYFGGVCNGKRGRGAAGKVPVFRLSNAAGWFSLWRLKTRAHTCYPDNCL